MTTGRKIKLNDFRNLSEFRYQIRKYLRFSEAAARAAGMEPQQQQLLLAIKGLPEDSLATIGELAERLQVQHHSAVELADRLEKGKYVLRSRSAEDRRQVLLELTAKGEEMLQDLARDYVDELEILAPELVTKLRRLLSN